MLRPSKNAEKDDFDQRLECAAPKRWSKYTTYNISTHCKYSFFYLHNILLTDNTDHSLHLFPSFLQATR